jgi:Flp pilus assembly protein TadB
MTVFTVAQLLSGMRLARSVRWLGDLLPHARNLLFTLLNFLVVFVICDLHVFSLFLLRGVAVALAVLGPRRSFTC